MCQDLRCCVSLCCYALTSSTVELLLFYTDMPMAIIWLHTCNTTFNLSVQLCNRFIAAVKNTGLLRNLPSSLMLPHYWLVFLTKSYEHAEHWFPNLKSPSLFHCTIVSHSNFEACIYLSMYICTFPADGKISLGNRLGNTVVCTMLISASSLF